LHKLHRFKYRLMASLSGLVSRRGALLASTILLAGGCIPSAAHAEPKQVRAVPMYVIAHAPALRSTCQLSRPSSDVNGQHASHFFTAHVCHPPQLTMPHTLQFELLNDNQLAYAFEYPTETASGKQLRLRLARGPSTYSSAPPLTPDGRQRIVTQLMDLNKNVTITVTVGPASGALKVKAPEEWRPNEVALTVLIERWVHA
jgi:hypothetical protein